MDDNDTTIFLKVKEQRVGWRESISVAQEFIEECPDIPDIDRDPETGLCFICVLRQKLLAELPQLESK